MPVFTRTGCTVNRGYSANRLNIHSILMRHGKRQVLTIRLVFAPGSLNEFAETGKIGQKLIYLSVLCLISADSKQQFSACIHLQDAIVRRDDK